MACAVIDQDQVTFASSKQLLKARNQFYSRGPCCERAQSKDEQGGEVFKDEIHDHLLLR